MGLSIHYKGAFSKDASLADMINEVSDIAETYKWNYHVFEKEFPPNTFHDELFNEDIYGILFSPPGCEPVLLCFLSNGLMGNPFMLQHYLKTKQEDDKKLIFTNFTKTQYAGAEIHKIIIHLIRYIAGKYIDNFQLTDEGNYWETGDEKLLDEKFLEYKTLIDGFADALQNNKMQQGETLENFLIKMANKIHKKRQ